MLLLYGLYFGCIHDEVSNKQTNKQTNCEDKLILLFLLYNTLPVDVLFKYNSLLLAHKISHHAHLLPNVFANYFLINKDVHSHDTRSKDLVHLPQYNKNIGHRNFKYLGGSLWNAIPKELKDIISINLFKKSIKTYLLRLLQNIT